jgi:hypothetical protein
MSRKSKMDNAAKLINIIGQLLERQEKLLSHIDALVDYVELLEETNNEDTILDDGMSFILDEELKKTIDENLSDPQRERLESIKEKKQADPQLFTMDEILKELEGND